MKRTSNRRPLPWFFAIAVLTMPVFTMPMFPAFVPQAAAQGPRAAQAPPARSVKSPTLRQLNAALTGRIGRVEEFQFIREQAEKLGVRAWLFGGTAAGYAHYVHWDLKREGGDPRFQPDRFDYDYTNIYRSTQDLDIVIDGSPRQAAALQSALQERYPHFQGSKSAWEVRLLQSDLGEKEALLDNPDFLNQHTDSNSTGMIEITRPPQGDGAVRDLRDWNSKKPFFLQDVFEGKLHYYFSPRHAATARARQGLNPPILSAVRYLTKAFQYELELRPEDFAKIRRIIDEFGPRAQLDPYVAQWLEKNGKKLIQHAVNIEYARDQLDQLGLRKKLIAIKNDPEKADTLAWWLNKEPLRSRPLGQGTGKTARQLGLDVVSHETGNFLAYESITRAHTGDPNVLISRTAAPDESAAHGDGFYTRVGRQGARGTGLTIRFHLEPKAREGTDFIRPAEAADYVVVTNKNALRVIPESLNVTPVQYFEMLARGKALNASDRGILEKLRRRMNSKIRSLSAPDEETIHRLVEQVASEDPKGNEAVLREWFTLDLSRKYPEILGKTIRADATLAQRLVGLDKDWISWIAARPEYVTLIAQSPSSAQDYGRFTGQILAQVQDQALVHRMQKFLLEYLTQTQLSFEKYGIANTFNVVPLKDPELFRLAIAALSAENDDRYSSTKISAAHIIAYSGNEDPTITRELIHALKKASKEFQQSHAMALRFKINDLQLQRELADTLPELMDHGARGYVLEALSIQEPKTQVVTDAFLAGLRDTNSDVQHSTVHLIRQSQYFPREIVTALKELKRGRDRMVKEIAKEALDDFSALNCQKRFSKL